MNTQDTPMSGFGTATSTDHGTAPTGGLRGMPGVCPTCGHSESINEGLEQFLGRLGISDDMIEELKTSFQNVDVEEYLNTARNYLRESSNKASMFARKNPRKVMAGAAVAALGAGILLKALCRK